MRFSQRISRGIRLGSTTVSMLLLLGACGDDSGDSSSGGAGGKGGSGGSEAAGKGGAGKAGAGGESTAPGGRGGDIPKTQQDPNAAAYHCVPKPGDDGGSARRGATCCGGLGRCMEPSADAPASLPHDACSASPDLRCVPLQPMAATDADGGMSNDGKYASCRVVLPGSPASFPDYEGRCLPSCLVQHTDFAARLSQGSCQQGETCAPCYSPLTGDATGNCSLFGDAPADPAPEGFAECSDGLGYCVPAFAAGMQASQLTQLTCKTGELCGPKAKVADPSACFEHCDAGTFGAGACVPMFLASAFATFLTTSTCSNAEVCAPCDIFGTRSGVCD
jgi:hypothetical protein